MSLFKILRGAEANLATTLLHDGWAYFTPDAENFYIDADGKRIWVNQKASNMYMSAKVCESFDLGSHTLFIAELTDAEVLSEDDSCTYGFYQRDIKPKPTKKAEKRSQGGCKINGSCRFW